MITPTQIAAYRAQIAAGNWTSIDVLALLDEIERLQFHSGLLKDALDASTGNHRCLIPKGPA